MFEIALLNPSENHGFTEMFQLYTELNCH